jgi:hypothetical protein
MGEGGRLIGSEAVIGRNREAEAIILKDPYDRAVVRGSK